MSEEINLNVNNLSASEEAFEILATSVYSQNEYETLPTGTCAQPVFEATKCERNEMPLDNNVVSSSNVEDQSELTYCNLEVGSEVNIDDEYTDGPQPALELCNDGNTDPSYVHEINCLSEENNATSKSVHCELEVEYSDQIEADESVEFEAVSSSEIYQPQMYHLVKEVGAGVEVVVGAEAEVEEEDVEEVEEEVGLTG